MTVLALVPARSGSNGLPGKNLAVIGGRSLVARAVQVARETPGVDRVAVSSDDAAILAEGERAGAETRQRPSHLAADATPTIDVVLHHLQQEADVMTLVLLQPTSPLRAVADVTRCLEALTHAEAVATVTPTEHPWQWTFRLSTTGAAEPVAGWDAFTARRQDLGDGYRLNGAVYVATRDWLVRTRTFIGPGVHPVPMPPGRSVDIDTALDLAVARAIHEHAEPA